MRIIAGSMRGKKLATFVGNQIRPTSDRTREALFSMLTSRLGSFHGLNVLELCAGTGAQSLEAISRGASLAVLIDQSSESLRIIKDNVQRCDFSKQVKIINGKLPHCLDKCLPFAPYDLIFIDPPYESDMIIPIFAQIETLNLLTDGGIICAETTKKKTLDYQGTLQLLDNRSYGSTAIHLFGYLEGATK